MSFLARQFVDAGIQGIGDGYHDAEHDECDAQLGEPVVASAGGSSGCGQ